MIIREINNVLINVYNNNETDNALKNYQEGYFKYEIRNEFKFIASDPNNKYSLIEKEYVPTFFSDHVGKIQPISSVYDEETTFTVQFAIADDKRAGFDFRSRYLEIEQFARDTRKISSEYNEDVSNDIIVATDIEQGQRVEILSLGDTDFTTIGAEKNEVGETFTATGSGTGTGTVKEVVTYYYTINSSPLTQNREPVIINGIKCYFCFITYSYRVSDVELGESDTYSFRLYNTTDNFYTVEDISRSSAYATVANPQQQVNSDFTTNTPGALVYKLTLNIFDDTNDFTTTIRKIWNRQLKMTETYFDLKEVVSGLETDRIVFIQNLQPINSKGLPKQWAITFVEANPLLIV